MAKRIVVLMSDEMAAAATERAWTEKVGVSALVRRAIAQYVGVGDTIQEPGRPPVKRQIDDIARFMTEAKVEKKPM